MLMRPTKIRKAAQSGSIVQDSSKIMDLTKDDEEVPLHTEEETKERMERITSQRALTLEKARQEQKKNTRYKYWEQTKFSAMEPN